MDYQYDRFGIARCPVCGDRIFRYSGGGHSECRCCMAEYQRLERSEKLTEWLEEDNAQGTHYLRYRLGDDDSETAQICRQYLDHWGMMRIGGNGILFSGNIGVGKTHYCASLVNAIRQRWLVSANMLTTTDLIRAVQSANDPTETLRNLNKYELVALDDLGAERNTDFAIEVLESFIDQRVLDGGMLFITTNLARKQLANPTDLRYARIYDRIRQLCVLPIIITGTSRRIADADERLAKCREILSSATEGGDTDG